MVSQPVGSQSGHISREEREQAIGAVMRHVLFKHSSHPGVPISRDEINKVISAQLVGRRVTGLPGVIIKEAQARFPAALGFDMKELERGTRGRGGGGGGGGHDGDEGGGRGGEDGGDAGGGRGGGGGGGGGAKEYVLQSRLPAAVLSRFVDTAEQAAGSAFTTVVCALIKGAGGSIPAEKLWALLGAMGVRRGEERHPQFGNVEECLKRMEKQRWVGRGWGGDGCLAGLHGEEAPTVWECGGESEAHGEAEGVRGVGGEEEWAYELAEHARQGIGAERLQKIFNETVAEVQDGGSSHDLR
ncbi:unnamed protein product [Closterium sp. Yama58-4]|nr:unnamed protein product [Closterium sp. Yama58-4]